MVTLTHKGYIAEVSYDEGDTDMHGTVLNARAVLHFAGSSVAELRQAFADTVADYEAWCRHEGEEPEKPYSGNIPLRIGPDLHRALALTAARAGRSINAYVADLIAQVVAETGTSGNAPKRQFPSTSNSSR